MKVIFHTSLFSAVRPPELIPNPSKEERRAGRTGKQDARVTARCPAGPREALPRKRNQADGSLISQNKTPVYFQETFICRISGMQEELSHCSWMSPDVS